jgi:hypothetical protein
MKFCKAIYSITVLVLVLIVTATQAVPFPDTRAAGSETHKKSTDSGKQTNESTLLMTAVASISGFQLHIDHDYKILFFVPEIIVTKRRVHYLLQDFLNKYFLTLFQYIISSKAP